MEQNMPIIAKKFWKIVKVAYFMLRKGISKAKLLSDLNMMMKRGKIAGKAAMQNLIFHVQHHHHHHHHSTAAAAEESQLSYPTPLNEYEYSCSSTPAYSTFRLPFHLSKRKQSHAAPPPMPQLSESELWAAAVDMASSVAPSPALPGFGRTPVVRQLRITDSPFPLREIEEDNRVDEAADEFIMKFYRDLKKQNAMAS